MSADIHTSAYTIYSATPGAGDWLIDCRLSGLAAGATTFTWHATVNGVTINGAAQVLTKDTAETTLQAVLPIHCAAAEAVVVTVLSSSASDTAVTASSTITRQGRAGSNSLFAVLKKNVASQNVPFTLVDSLSGEIVTGLPTGGTFTLNLQEQNHPDSGSAVLAWNLSAADLLAAFIAGLDNVSNYLTTHSGDTVLSGGPLPGTPVVITNPNCDFSGNSVSANALIGNFTPAPSVVVSGTGNRTLTISIAPTAGPACFVTKDSGSQAALATTPTPNGRSWKAPFTQAETNCDLLHLLVNEPGYDVIEGTINLTTIDLVVAAGELPVNAMQWNGGTLPTIGSESISGILKKNTAGQSIGFALKDSKGSLVTGLPTGGTFSLNVLFGAIPYNATAAEIAAMSGLVSSYSGGPLPATPVVLHINNADPLGPAAIASNDLTGGFTPTPAVVQAGETYSTLTISIAPTAQPTGAVGYLTIDSGTQQVLALPWVVNGHGQWSQPFTQAETNGDILKLLLLNTDCSPVSGNIRTTTLDLADISSVNGRVKAVAQPAFTGVGSLGFQFALSAAAAEPKVLSADSTSVEDTHSLDATRRDTTHTVATIGTQWQLSVSVLQHDPDWTVTGGGDPSVLFTSSDPAVATVDSAGLITYVGNGTCTITGVSNPTTRSVSLQVVLAITNSSSGGNTTVTTTYLADAFDAAKHVLVIYNEDSASSTSLKSYYLAHRPGMATANVLGLTGIADATSTDKTTINNLILTPVYNWLIANEATKPIRYIVLMRGVPSRQGSSGSVGYMLYTLLSDRAYRTGSGYQNGESRFTRLQYQGVTCLPSWIDGGSYPASTAMIDKLAEASAGLQADGITISGAAASVGGSKWILDDTRDVSYAFAGMTGHRVQVLEAEGIDAGDITEQAAWNGSLIATTADVTYYQSWGVHSGALAASWGNDGSITFSGKSGWWLGMSIESFNGIYGGSQGNPTEFFSDVAFGGTAYANTPVCFVGHTAEPYLGGVSTADYADRWARGWTAAEAAWAGRMTPSFIVVGDPLVTR